MPEPWLASETRHALWHADAEQLVVVGWRPGPAGVSAVDLSPALRVVVDHASPTTLTELLVHAPGGTLRAAEIRVLETMFGTDIARQLVGLPRSRLGVDGRPLRLEAVEPWPDLPDRRPGTRQAERLARAVVAADLGDDGDLPQLARAFARLEAARTFAEMVDLMGRDLVLGQALEGLAWLDEVSAGNQALDDTFRHDLIGELTVARGFLRMLGDGRFDDQADELWQRGMDAVERLTARSGAFTLRRRWEDDGGVASAAAMAAPAAPVAPVVARAAPATAATTAARQRTARGEPSGPEPVEVDARAGARALAWVDPGNNVEVSAPATAEGSWARVFRRRDDLLLGLSPLRRDDGEAATAGVNAGVRAVVVIPPGHTAADLVVDVTDHPDGLRPSGALIAVRAAVRAGRDAARLERLAARGAGDAWGECAELWRAAGDDQRANLAIERAKGGRQRGSAGFSSRIQPFVADRLV